MRRDEYEIRPLTIADLPLMRAIEEASFSTPWPGNAYESELTTNRLARYVGAWRAETRLFNRAHQREIGDGQRSNLILISSH